MHRIVMRAHDEWKIKEVMNKSRIKKKDFLHLSRVIMEYNNSIMMDITLK